MVVKSTFWTKSARTIFITGRKNMMGMRQISVVILAALVLASCSIIPKAPPPPKIFDLTQVAELKRRKTLPIVVSIGEPRADRSIDSDGILVRLAAEQQLTYFPASTLPDRLPKLVQKRMIESLSGSRGFVAVLSVGASAREDYRVLSNILSFEVIEKEEGDKSAFVKIKYDILDAGSRRIITNRSFSASAPVADTNSSELALGLSLALKNVEVKALPWIYSSLSKAVAKAKAEEEESKSKTRKKKS